MSSLWTQAEYAVTLHNGDKQYQISPQLIEQLEDPTASFTIEQVTSPLFNSRFKASGESMLRNSNRESAYWLKLTILNKTDKSQQWLIESFNFRINEISCYMQTNTGFSEVIEGDQYKFSQRSVGHKNFEFLIPNSKEQIICYLRIRTKQPASFELYIRRFDAFTTYAIGEYFLLGIFYGTIGIVALFSLLMLLSFRKIVFLYYSLFLTGFAVFFMCQDGTGFQYLWANYPFINTHSISISRLLMLIPYTLYFCAFLEIKQKSPWIWKAMMVWIVVRIVIACIPQNNDQFLSLIMYYDYIPFIVAYLSAIYAYYKGFKPALYFAIGFSVLLISFIINSLRVACIVESNIFTAYSLNFGAVLEILFLSLSLGSWLKIMIQEKIVTENINKILEERVSERTEVLQIQNEIINEKVDELDTLFYRLSHDIKGPIKSILGLANLGLIDVLDRENYFKLIQGSALKLDKITTDFRELSNIKKSDKEEICEIDFEHLLNKIQTSLEPTNEYKTIVISKDIHQTGVFRSHEHIIYTVIENIIENAMKYTKVQVEASKLDILIRANESKAILQFTDNGIGIQKENREHIFTMFFREHLKEEISGTGLGLYIVKMSLEKINGTITYQPVSTGGTTFIVEIPNVI
ncbi:sensor histidine kinase [uncultured Cytophaga sp.]|uniref:sensor histidine kinase n=1 Tax=uncultured Cytophaga sp. TaxID=160238 RepID=UPI002622BB28|nr:sensor histidine kinase [uncultured Cytophaga sp.]